MWTDFAFFSIILFLIQWQTPVRQADITPNYGKMKKKQFSFKILTGKTLGNDKNGKSLKREKCKVRKRPAANVTKPFTPVNYEFDE